MPNLIFYKHCPLAYHLELIWGERLGEKFENLWSRAHKSSQEVINFHVLERIKRTKMHKNELWELCKFVSILSPSCNLDDVFKWAEI